MAMLHVAVTGRDKRHLSALGGKLRVVVVGFREGKRGIVVDAYIPSAKVGWLERHGYGVTRIEEIDTHDRERQAQGRAAVRVRLKRGRYGDVIWSGGYLTADEVERAMEIGEQNHAGYLERIPLPNLTWEKRQVHAVRIGKGDGTKRPARGTTAVSCPGWRSTASRCSAASGGSPASGSSRSPPATGR